MRTVWLGLGAALVVAGAMAVGADAAEAGRGPLTGSWGGDQAVLTLTDKGGRLEFGCGYATFVGPVNPDRRGRFKAKGTYYPEQGGPVVADKPPTELAARFGGTVKGPNLRLSFEQDGAGAPQTFSMIAGKRQKLIRCL